MVVAGGSGQRFGAPKQFLPLDGRPVVTWAVESARSVAEAVVLVVPAEVGPEDDGTHWGADLVVTGGATRSASVRRGLALVPDDVELVLVHDAARPLASPGLFASVVDALAGDRECSGVVPLLPVADTLKYYRDDVVTGTLDRDGIGMVQTPQGFRAATLRQVHAAGDDATDDAALLEAHGHRVGVVPGESTNLKITRREDLAVIEALRRVEP